MVYLKQEKFQSAEFHFTKATTIFRTNPDLICHLAVVRFLFFVDLIIEIIYIRLNINVIDLKVH
jgi:hypothetical protein